MTGMFQSSRIASGRPRLQASSAFSPSSASMIWKSSPSRIRRATFRMTLESSTTRHVLMTASHFLPPTGMSAFQLCVARSCRLCIRRELEHAIDSEDDHELAIETVNATGQLGHARIEIDGVLFLAVLGQAQHLTDLVDQESVGFTAQVDAHRHRRLAVLGLRQAEARTHVDHGDDA